MKNFIKETINPFHSGSEASQAPTMQLSNKGADENLWCDSFNGADTKMKFKRCVTAVRFTVRLNKILHQVKIFGTSINLFDLNWRNKDFVRDNLKTPMPIIYNSDSINDY